MYFPVADISVQFWIPPLVAFVVSFFTSMGGVSGAFLLLPFQMTFLGFTSPSVSATNQVYNIVAIPSGVWRYMREGRMVWPLTWIVILGTLPGVFLGAIIRVAWLPDPGHFKLFAALVLAYIGLRMARDLVTRSGGSAKGAAESHFQEMAARFHTRQDGQQGMRPVEVLSFTRTRLEYRFYEETFEVSTLGVSALCFVVGIVGGVYGIGGGSIVAPFLVSILGLPVYTVAGAALMGTFVTSVAGVVFYQLIQPWYPGMHVAPDWALGLLFGLGGMAGMYLGARCQKFVPARVIKGMLCVILLFTAAKYALDAL
ncbi:MAG: sulfite exporter TauE/SafE family protein [Proteobacteria bacterium]|nr:sulfite exporter TauE/SafE family protein [Pseudomonadota bacterium]